MEIKMKTIQEIVKELEATIQCSCDLDNWQPEKETGHSWVCRIHNLACDRYYLQDNKPVKPMTDSEWIS
jgi:hypothetical protein